jgi:hypothetical protein
VLLTRSPLGDPTRLPEKGPSFDLHALGTPPTFVLSQDQTLQRRLAIRRPESLMVSSLVRGCLAKPCIRFWHQIVVSDAFSSTAPRDAEEEPPVTEGSKTGFWHTV